MNTAVAERQDIAATVDDVIARGDLSKLTPEQRVVHYHAVCKSLGLNHLTQPFMYVTLNGKLQLYAKRDACDQLRKINGINIEIAQTSVTDGLLTVHVRATDKGGRKDEDFGVVSVMGLKGEAASNAFMKAVTKAKRRVTLSISGLGLADETEVEDSQPQYASFTPKPLPPREVTPPAETDAAPERAGEPYEIPRANDDTATWSEWTKLFMAYVRAAPSADIINDWLMVNADSLAALQTRSEKTYAKLVAQVNEQVAAKSGEDE